VSIFDCTTAYITSCFLMHVLLLTCLRHANEEYETKIDQMSQCLIDLKVDYTRHNFNRFFGVLIVVVDIFSVFPRYLM